MCANMPASRVASPAHLSDGAVPRRLASGDHVRHRAPDGQGGRAFALDPIDIRRRNLVKSFPYTSVTGLTLDEASYVETMDLAVQACDVAGFRAAQKEGARKDAISGSVLPLSASAPATARRHLPRAAWK